MAADFERVAEARVPLLSYANAFRCSNNCATSIAPRLRDAYPDISPKAVANWEQQAERAEKIDSSVRWGPFTVRGDSATMYFTLNLNFVLRGNASSKVNLRHLAKLARRNGTWSIVSLESLS